MSDQKDALNGILQVDGARATWRRVGNELVILDLTDSSYLSVNDSGTAIWPMLEVGATRSDMVAAILDQFDVERETAETDLDGFLTDLSDRKLLITPSGE